MRTILLVLMLMAGCTMVHPSSRGGTVSLGRCDIIVSDTLGDRPNRHGGPRSRSDDGNGVFCDVVRF